MIKDRCFNPNGPGYGCYGGRGITMHEPWRRDYRAFCDWVSSNLGQRPDGMTLDRIDVNGNYEPGNLRWADAKTQAFNRRPHGMSAQIVEALRAQIRSLGAEPVA